MDLNQRGMSLVEIMIAIGMLGAVSLAFNQLMLNQNKTMKTSEIKAELLEISSLIRQTLDNKETCEATFIGMAPGDNLSEIRVSSDLSKEPFLRVGQQFKNYNVRIAEIRLLTRTEESEPQYNLGGANFNAQTGVGYAHLEVTFEKEIKGGKQNFFGGKDSKKIFPIRGVFADYKLLTSCEADDLEPLCEQEASSQGAIRGGRGLIRDPLTNDPTPFDVEGCPAKGYMYECNIFKDSFPIVGCDV